MSADATTFPGVHPRYEPPPPPRFVASPWRALRDEATGVWMVERAVSEDHAHAEGWTATYVQQVRPTCPPNCTPEREERRARELASALRRLYDTP